MTRRNSLYDENNTLIYRKNFYLIKLICEYNHDT